ncbi:hypothetical protein yberc0001_1090 [Yersinia bercovieri ATCC 43970]|uniref:Uncharacterized protein n=1 Tax=Yersinia bercovieri ATCC 43970 TaxID=349968 RepID=A0ABP2E829_YERBE|nr:hypothetical protein yberc0001_1090 [Yersinia bercovieri ATCC 43970]
MILTLLMLDSLGMGYLYLLPIVYGGGLLIIGNDTETVALS